MNLNTLSSLAILPVVYFTRGIDFTEVTEQGAKKKRLVLPRHGCGWGRSHRRLAGASNLFHLRLAFGVVQVLVLMASIFIRMRIMASENTAAGKREILVTPPKAPMQAEEPVPKRMTVFEYDLEQWNSALKSNVVQLLILGLIHYKWCVQASAVCLFVF